MLQALLNNIKVSLPLGITSFDASFKYGVSEDTKATNKANKEMNAQNNQTQIDLWNQQKEYDYKMWQENNAYNTPSAQVERLRAAGINPALALSNISSGESRSTAGGQSTPQTTPATFENPANEVNMKVQNLALIGKQLSDISKQYEETRSLQMQNNWQNVEKSAAVASILKDNKLKDEAVENASLANRLFRDTYSAKVMEQEENANIAWRTGLNLSAQGSLIELQKDSADYYNKHVQPQELTNLKAQYGNIVANSFATVLDAKTRSALAKSQIKLNDEQIKAISENVKKTCAETKGLEFVNRLNDSTVESQIRKIVADGINSSMQPFWNSFGVVGDILKIYRGGK